MSNHLSLSTRYAERDRNKGSETATLAAKHRLEHWLERWALMLAAEELAVYAAALHAVIKGLKAWSVVGAIDLTALVVRERSANIYNDALCKAAVGATNLTLPMVAERYLPRGGALAGIATLQRGFVSNVTLISAVTLANEGGLPVNATRADLAPLFVDTAPGATDLLAFVALGSPR